jgi:urease accessory protein
MSLPSELLVLLQHGDSFFPSGGFASSWGLETLYAERQVRDAATLASFVDGQLRCRWAVCDRAALRRVYQAGENLEAVMEIDEEVEVMSLARDLREASRRAGRALLRVHSQLGTTQAMAYLERIRGGQAYGHVPIAQGLVWRHLTSDVAAAETLAGHLLCVAFVSAAIRLGCVSHIDAQQVLTRAHATLNEVLQLPPPSDMSSFTPAADIAMMRHEVQEVRLFAS